MEIKDTLWPDLMTQEIKITPKQILAQQAAYLGEQTKNILTAEVRNSLSPGGVPTVNYDFIIFAPVLKYSFHLFKASHKLDSVYPLLLKMTIKEGIRNFGNANSESELKSKLKEIFTVPEIVEILQSLIAQSK